MVSHQKDERMNGYNGEENINTIEEARVTY